MNSAIGNFDNAGKQIGASVIEAELRRRIIELETEIVRLTPASVAVTQRAFVVPLLPAIGNTEDMHMDVQSMITLIYAMLLNGASDYEIKQRLMGLG